MKCPTCDIALTMTERQGVEIDYCVKCRGIWLDRGELDKLIERSAARQDDDWDDREHADHARRDHDDDHTARYPNGRRKRKSFLGEMFEIFD